MQRGPMESEQTDREPHHGAFFLPTNAKHPRLPGFLPLVLLQLIARLFSLVDGVQRRWAPGTSPKTSCVIGWRFSLYVYSSSELMLRLLRPFVLSEIP